MTSRSSEMEIADRLKVIRMEQKLSQAEMGSLMGVSQRAYSSYEAGKTMPSVAAIRGLVEIGCDPNWLVTGRSSQQFQAQSQTMNPTAEMLEIDAIEAKLAETGGTHIDISNMTDEQAEMYAALQRMAATATDDRVRARADLYLTLVWTDPGASTRYETRQTAIFSRFRRANEIVSRAEADLGWAAPMLLREAMKALIFEYDISEGSAREALDMIHLAWRQKDGDAPPLASSVM